MPAGRPELTVVSNVNDVDWPNAKLPPDAELAADPNRKITHGAATGVQAAAETEYSAWSSPDASVFVPVLAPLATTNDPGTNVVFAGMA